MASFVIGIQRNGALPGRQGFAALACLHLVLSSLVSGDPKGVLEASRKPVPE
jgi:hypothetical protein